MNKLNNKILTALFTMVIMTVTAANDGDLSFRGLKSSHSKNNAELIGRGKES